MIFQDRRDAGRQLARRLTHLRGQDAIVLALPRGGIVVGYEIARALGTPLDVIVARKLGAPGNPEFGFGAIAPGGVRFLDEQTVGWLGLSEEQIDRIAAEEALEMERRLRRYRGGRPLPDVRQRAVILVDDGLATGVTARAAIRAIRRWEPGHLVLAVPVSAPDTARAVSSEVDELVCLETPPGFMAVGQYYMDFEQTSDEEVIELIERARREAEGGGGSEPRR
jgi:predicted phosphoribosyltransferase